MSFPTESTPPMNNPTASLSSFPAAEGPENAPSVAHSLPDSQGLRSCVTCRRRKVRCNKRCPCSNCTRAGIECIFPPPGRASRKSKRPQDAELLSRLKRLEGVIEHLSEKNAGAPNTPSPPQQSQQKEPTPTEPSQSADAENCPFANMDPRKPPKRRNLEHEFGRLVIEEGRSRYVSNRLWASLGDEVEELQDILDPSSSDEEDYPSPESSSTLSGNHEGFLFGFYSLSQSLRSFHPPPAKVSMLWDIYLENVAPLVPIMHKPTVKQLFASAAQKPESLDKNSEALILAMYFVSIISLSTEECRAKFGEEREVLVGRYRFAVEQALAKANFLNTQHIMVLQAVVIFLIAVRREDDTKFVWSMTALVLRLAQGLGIHRDGTNFGLKPFDTEMRRRLWWHICLLDIRSSEDHGTDAQIHERIYDTRLPLNINDEDITPGMLEPPKERIGYTDMSFCLIRCDITVALRRVSYTCPNNNFPGPPRQPSPELCGKLIKAVNDRIEEQYLKHCDMSIPIQWVCATVGRLILTKLWLVVHHPMTRPYQGINLTNDSRESLFVTSVQVAEFSRLLAADKNTHKWNWLFATNMQWQSIAFVLSEICVRPINPLTDRAWNAVSSLYGDWMLTAKQRKGMLWRPLARLMKRASACREKKKEEMRLRGDPFPSASNTTAPRTSQGQEIVPPPVLPQLSELEALYGMDSNNQPDTEPNIDLRGGPLDAISGMFPGVDWLAVPTSQSPSEQSLSFNPNPSLDPTMTLPDQSSMVPLAPQGDLSSPQLNWDEWDQVMRDFHMDLQQAHTTNPNGNFPAHVSDWFM
ncbi:putative C6 transcription factor [Aspergillus affinis]|uniref:putative C6 transcription factor n=1 Tax=Aspergillus affinis TaxID=1070780 RepID=UPI0022FE2823|nr:Zn(II)2Cys6 transcription factor [Aspergillus affinis]KAI9043284.1 Zn(II)2Cys6 transcription factor [Aspergillus affinis]